MYVRTLIIGISLAVVRPGAQRNASNQFRDPF
jgi:hypothetical protein